MKRFILSCIVCIASAASLMAQKYEPNTEWPYIYENFTDGKIYLAGNATSSAKLNIHLWGNVLHYVDGEGRIRSYDNERDILRAEIGTDAYLLVDGKWMQLLHQNGKNLLLRLRRGKFDDLTSGSTGAYGASLSSSGKTLLSSLDLGGMDQPELGRLLQRRYDGRTISLATEYVYVVNDQVVNATKKDVTAFVADDRQAELKSFLKTAKTKWKNEESLAALLDFLSK